MERVIIDVREKDEFQNGHAPGAINVPLSCFPQDAPSLLNTFGDKKVIMMCVSGKRASLAFDHVKEFPNLSLNNYEIYPEGMKGWEKEGNEVVSLKSAPLSLMRQVQIAAGSLILTGAALGTLVNPSFWFISAFVGAGLTFSGISGTCGLAAVLNKMPWNK